MTPRRDPAAGLTLFEMLIVMAIIGIASTAAVMGTSVLTRDTRAQDEATRLATLMQGAADEALVNAQPLVLEWTAGGYGFRRWLGEDAGWGSALDARLTAFRALPSDLSLARQDGQAGAIAIDPGGTGSAVRMQLGGTDTVWTVAFDGIRAQALPAQAAP